MQKEGLVFYFIFLIQFKMASFWSQTDQNDVVLISVWKKKKNLMAKINDVIFALKRPKRHRFGLKDYIFHVQAFQPPFLNIKKIILLNF